MYGYIILKDIPKEEAQLDLSLYEIKGGFRGFAEVLPGVHFVTIKDGNANVTGFWCAVESDEVIMKRYNYETKNFEDFDDDFGYKELALSGAMNHSLISVQQKSSNHAKHWFKLTNYLRPSSVPLKLFTEKPSLIPTDLSFEELEQWFQVKFKSRFESAFYETHKGNVYSFLEELQYSFITYALFKNSEALDRWFYLLQAIYNAGEHHMIKSPELFKSVPSIIIPQFNFFQEQDMTTDSKLISGIRYLIEDMIDTEHHELIEEANLLKKYLQTRKIDYLG